MCESRGPCMTAQNQRVLCAAERVSRMSCKHLACLNCAGLVGTLLVQNTSGLAGARGRSGRGAPKSGAPGWGAGRCKNFGGAEIQNRTVTLKYRTRICKLITLLHCQKPRATLGMGAMYAISSDASVILGAGIATLPSRGPPRATRPPTRSGCVRRLNA